MKKVLTFIAFAAAMNVSVAKAYPPPQLLDDSASFRIAKSVKLGYGDASAPAQNKGTKKADFNTCSSDSQCLASQKCVNGKCVPVCTSTTCSGETPKCESKDHSFTCECTETSCGTGKQCVGGKCETCAVGSKCNCDGEKVIDSSGKCVCPAGVGCSAGQYVSDDCSCKSCMENDTDRNKCGCPGNTVPDGSGSCYCKTKKSCGEGFSFDSTNTCECVACTDNASCDNPCPKGSFPNGSGCGTYACMDDSSCAAGNKCENGGTESAQCVPCGKNEQCNCPDGQLSDGSGKCVPVVCKTGLTCSSSVTAQCCDAGMQCVNPDTVESYCAACETDTQCTCPAGYVVNSSGKCVKPDCTKDSDCANGTKCDNAGKSTAACTSCAKGETCTCTGGMVADGKGGCEFGCEFSSASACKAGTKNCTNCSMTGGCYVCSACGTWYELSNGKCTPKACPPSLSTNKTCGAGTRVKNSTAYSGSEVCQSCEPCASGEKCGCPDGQVANGSGGCKDADPCANVTCDNGKVCSKGSCVCPSNKPYADSNGNCQPCLQDSHCGTNKYCYNNGAGARSCDDDCSKVCPIGYRNGGRENVLQNGCSNGYVQNGSCNNGRPCWACAAAACPSGYSTDTTSCDTSKGYKLETSGTSAGKACGRCVSTACPSGYSTAKTSCTKNNEKLETNGYSGGKACGKCVLKKCSEINSSYKTSCNAGDGDGATWQATGSDGECYTCKTCYNSSCAGSYKCVGGNCTPVCMGVTACTGTTPVCTGYNHAYVCECNDSSCPSGQYCDNSSPRKCVAKTKTCSDYGYYPYASDTMSKYCQPMGSGYHPETVTVSGLTCHKCVKSSSSNTGSGCTKKSPSSSARYTAGQSFCYFISSEARNAWLNGGCAQHVSCSTVRAAYHGNNRNCYPWVQISAEGFIGAQGEDCH